MTTRVRDGILAAIVAALAIYLFATHASAAHHVDTNAFYCGATVLHAGDDPYRFGPLHRCEARNLPLGRYDVYPIPLPPYAIAMLFPLSAVSFTQANLIWLFVLLGAAFVIAATVARLARLPYWLVGLCVLADMLLEPLANGAMAPIPIALLCAAALAVAAERYSLCAVLVALAFVQPHVALAPAVALFVLIPAMRVRLAAAALALLALTLAAGHLALDVEYLRTVLPMHAAAELASSNQYSLSSLLHFAGASDRFATAVGTLQYICFVAFGVLLAKGLMGKLRGSVILAPAMCAVTGGSFIHQTEIAGALPFALLVAANAPSLLTWSSVAVLALPLEYLADYGAAIVAGLVVAAVGIYAKRERWAGILCVAIAVSLGLALANRLVAIPILHVPPPAMSPNDFADISWKAMQAQFPGLNAFWWPTHMLTYAALLAVYCQAIAMLP